MYTSTVVFSAAGVTGTTCDPVDEPPPQPTRSAVANNSAMSERDMFFIKGSNSIDKALFFKGGV